MTAPDPAEVHTLDESGYNCSCHARFSTRWEAAEHAGLSHGGLLAALAIAELKAALTKPTPPASGSPSTPSLCEKCDRTISEHWDFPSVCDGFKLREKTPPACVSGEVVTRAIKLVRDMAPLHEQIAKSLYADRDIALFAEAAELATMLAAAPEAATPSAVGGVDRMWEAAQLAYRICAETRHVTLGDKVRAAILALASGETSPERDDNSG